MTAPDSSASIASPPPSLDAVDAVSIARRFYGVEAEARPLVSERDQNFLLQCGDGKRFILKIANVAEDCAVTEFQVEALLHIEAMAGPELDVPRVIRCRQGAGHIDITSSQGRHVARLVSWLPGEPMEQHAPTASMASSLGGVLAVLDRALEGFRHPGESQVLLWDMKRATDLRPLTRYVADGATRALLDATLDEFEAHALPAFAGLPWQVIHNDANPSNLLVSDEPHPAVTGVIDFGDMLYSPRVIELAVAGSYLRVARGDPLVLIRSLLAGYHARLPVMPAEVEVLHSLVKTRLATSVIILAWRASLRGADDEYLAAAGVSEASALPFLERLADIPSDRAAADYGRVVATASIRHS